MAYFPNGTSGMAYQDKYCDRCKNMKDKDDGRGMGCPIWDAHLILNYDQQKNPFGTTMLNMLIPTKDGNPQECSMFDCIDGEIEGQMHFGT